VPYKTVPVSWMCALSKIFHVLSISVRCDITPLGVEWQLGGENFTENCLIWLVTQPLELCFILCLL